MLRLLVPALLLGLLALNAASAAASHVGCGDTITQDTTLDSDLTCPGDGLVIGAHGVTLDLGGHTISGAGAAFSAGVRFQNEISPQDVTIRRGTIRGFDVGILAEPVERLAVRRLAITNNVTGIVIDISFDVVVRNNVIADNSGLGLWVLDSNTVRVTGNDVLRNGADGIHFGGEVQNSVAEGNVASGNGDDGIEVAEFVVGEIPNTLARNLATYNGDLGVEAVAGTLDGGGNRAFGNGNPLQCIGIACK
jgi:parallel beta-helix repeat protein